MESMKHSLTSHQSTDEFRSQILSAVGRMDSEDLSHVEADGVLVADEAVAQQYLDDPRYRHIGREEVEGHDVQVFLFVHAG